jgi:hypothetical protein
MGNQDLPLTLPIQDKPKPAGILHLNNSFDGLSVDSSKAGSAPVVLPVTLMAALGRLACMYQVGSGPACRGPDAIAASAPTASPVSDS